MNTTDHRAEAERILRFGGWDASTHLLAAIHDELRAIRDHVTEPRWIVPDPEPDDDCCDRLREERDVARDERDRARTQIISLAGDLPGKDEVVVRRADVEFALEFGCLRGTMTAARLRDALEARS